MPDWIEVVKERLGPLGLDPRREQEIIAEVASHLEELCDDFRRRGWSEEESVRQAIAAVLNWAEIRQRIRFTEEGEGTMNQRIRSLWLPGLCAAAIAYVLPHLSGLVYSWVVAETTNLKIPAIILGATYLFGLIGTGAGAAYMSRRMGGGPRHQLLGALLPAGMWVVAFVMLTGLSRAKVAYPQMKFHELPLALLLVTAIIALPLLVGAGLVILQSRWSNSVHPDSRSGGAETPRGQAADRPIKRWMHRCRMSHV